MRKFLFYTVPLVLCFLLFWGLSKHPTDKGLVELVEARRGAYILGAIGVTPFFESCWGTGGCPSDSGVGADDELCDTDPCPGTWDAIGDDGNQAVTGGKLVVTIADDVQKNLRIDNVAGNVLENFTATEWWITFTVEFSDVDSLGASLVILHQASNRLSVKLEQDGGGTIDGWRNVFYHDAGFTTDSEIAWSPVATTVYTVRHHYKADTDGGADVADNGEYHWSVCVSPPCNAALTSDEFSIDSDTIGAPSEIQTKLQNFWDDATSYTITFDDYKLYDSDPGWTWN